jgi:sugar phosphate permease
VRGAGRGAIIAFACVLALDAADKAALGALAPALRSQFDLDNAQIGLLASAFSVIGGIVTVPMGILTDRTSRIVLVVVSILIWSAAMGVAAAATVFGVFLVARCALGVLTAAGGPPVTSMIGDLFSPDVRGRVIGWVKSGELVGAAIGLLVSGALVAVLSWRAVFLVLGAIGLFVAFGVARVGEPTRGGEGRAEGDERTLDEPSQLRDLIEDEGIEAKEELVLDGDVAEMPSPQVIGYVFRVRTLAAIIGASAMGEFFFAALQVFGVLYLTDAFGVSASAAALLIVGIGVSGFLGVISGGALGDALIGRRVIRGRIQVGAWSYLAGAVLFVPALVTSSLAVALPFLVLAGAFLLAPTAPLEAARLDVVHPQLRGRAESVRTIARTAALAVSPLVFGYLSEHLAGGGAEGLRAAFLVFLPLLACSSLLLVVAAREYPAEVASVQESVVEVGDG